MDVASVVANVLTALAGLGLIAYLLNRLMRWARGRTRGASVLGAVLTEVTHGALVQEAKQHKKRAERDGGDPSKEE
jgi:hypothetical protein